MALGTLLLARPLGQRRQLRSHDHPLPGDTAWASPLWLKLAFHLNVEESGSHISHVVLVPWPQISSSILLLMYNYGLYIKR